MKSSETENRRHPRVETPSLSFGPSLQGLVTWPNFEISQVLNLSRGGVRVARPGLFEIQTGTRFEVELTFGSAPAWKVLVRPVWRTSDQSGLEFGALTPQAHRALDLHLGAALIGQRLRAIDPEYFAEDADFTDWFQGPNQTHVFVTRGEAGEITRVEMSLLGERLELRRGESTGPLDHAKRQALLVLSQMDKAGLDVEDFARTLVYGAESF